MAVLPSWGNALCQSSVWEPLERRIYPAKTETFLYNNEVRQCVGHRFFAPINGHPAVMRRRVVLLQPSPQLLLVTVFQKNVNLHYRRDSMSKYAAKIQLFADTSEIFYLFEKKVISLQLVLSADFINVIHLTMKKLFLLGMMCLMALSIQAQKRSVELDFQLGTNVTDRGGSVSSSSADDSTGYTDLGLPSGTIWKNFNATGFYTSDEAVSQFGNRLPTKQQWEELKAECQWSWNGSGYKVTGPNGNSIVLPASGDRNCDGSVYYVGSDGNYWSSTPKDSDYAWYLYFYSGGVHVDNGRRCRGLSVRLVQD